MAPELRPVPRPARARPTLAALTLTLALVAAGCGDEPTIVGGPGARAVSGAVADGVPLEPGALYEIDRPGALWYRMEPEFQQAIADRRAGTPAWEGDAARKGNPNVTELKPGTRFRINKAVDGGAMIMVTTGSDTGYAGWIERASIPAGSVGRDPNWLNAAPGMPPVSGAPAAPGAGAR